MHLKNLKAAFSYRFFSKQAGLKSPNFLKLVMDGARNLSPESIEKCSAVFKHNKEEAVYFRNLVLLNQSTTTEEKKFHTEQLLRSKQYRKAHPLSTQQHDYYSNWYLVPIREMVGSAHFVEDAAWIAKNLVPSITTAEAKKALETLETLGLVSRDKSGKLIQTDEFVSTGNEVTSSMVAQWHREMIQKGSEAIDRIPSDKREVSAVTIGLSEEGAAKVKKLIQEFRRELLVIANQETNIEGVYQVNFQLFGLTESLNKKEQDK